MSNYTTAEVEEAIERHLDNDGDWWDFEEAPREDDTDETSYANKYHRTTLNLRGDEVRVYSVANFGGEGQGDDRWVVFKVGTQLFRKNGYYQSHDGTYWDGDLYEVEPREVVRTEYVRV